MIYTGQKKGDSHITCEDSFFVQDLEDIVIGGVFDGCSTGVNSHFASALLAKCFYNKMKTIYDFEMVDKYVIDNQIRMSIEFFILTSNLLHLEQIERLSTAFVFYYYKKSKVLVYYCFGDGYINVNYDNELIITSPGNAPDYIGYYTIDNPIPIKATRVENVENFTIATDGITALREVIPSGINPIDYLVKDKTLEKSQSMLGRKLNILSHNFSFQDDITLIRYECNQ